VQNWLTCLGSLYEYARRGYDDIAPDNPFHGHNLEARASIVSYEPFEAHHMQKLLDAAEPEIRNIIIMGLFSGCRLDELASLKKSEIKRWKVYAVSTFRNQRLRRGYGTSLFIPAICDCR
jgi:integrase